MFVQNLLIKLSIFFASSSMYVLHKAMGALFYIFLAWLVVNNSEIARQFLNKTKDAVSVLPFFRNFELLKREVETNTK